MKVLKIILQVLLAIIMLPIGIIAGLVGFVGITYAIVKIPFRSDLENATFREKLKQAGEILKGGDNVEEVNNE